MYHYTDSEVVIPFEDIADSFSLPVGTEVSLRFTVKQDVRLFFVCVDSLGAIGKSDSVDFKVE